MYNPKRYFHNGRFFEWGKDLRPAQMDGLRAGEVFILLGKDGKPHSKVLMDSYDQIREKLIEKGEKVGTGD